MLFQSGGCCDGSSPMCLPEGELPSGPNDLLLGEVGGAPFYIDARAGRALEPAGVLLDVAPGAATGFSLEGLLDLHFAVCTPPAAVEQRDRAPA